MSIHRLEARLQLSASLDQVWAFFADPRNLAHVTPAEMGFTVRGEVPGQMYAGLLVAYTVRPLFGVPVGWLTEITHIEPHRYFVDEQRRGPYRLWHHQHHFVAVEGGVGMHDILHYELPFGPLGDMLDRVLVRRRIEHIFAFRRAVLLRRFGEEGCRAERVRNYG